MYTCYDCNLKKKVSEFIIALCSDKTRRGICRGCNKARVQQWQSKNKIRSRVMIRNCQLRSKYNIDVIEYNRMLQSQAELCAICKQGCITGRRLAVDHCHKTGKIRGLLCINCNRGLGKYEKNKDKFEKYLAFYQS